MTNNPHLIQYKLFAPYDKLFAFTSTKQTLNVKNVRYSNRPENRIKLAEALHINPEKLVFPSQTHTNCVVDLSDYAHKLLDNTDALVSNKSGLCICVQTADCVPILLFDPHKKVVAAVHAGWRGTVGKIVAHAIDKMVGNYQSDAQHIIAAIGPSISANVYEVGPEVVEAARKSVPNAEKTLFKNNADKFHFNLWEANRQLLLASGLKLENIEILGDCSYLKSHKYYSARAEGMDTGRMVSGIMLL